MKILALLNMVCDLMGLSQIDTISGDHDENTALLVALLQQSGAEVSVRIDWPQFLCSTIINHVPFNLPEDFHRPLRDGAVMMRDHSFARQVMTVADWQIVHKNSRSPWYWINDKVLHLTINDRAILRYFSKNWVMSSQNDQKSMITSDDDLIKLPTYLLIKDIIWRWRRSQGLDFSNQLQEFETSFAAEKLLLFGT
ncbi:MAG: hypothetical protein EU981_02570 [Candidatus Liberibacter ctenarytainae]|uniref:Uncharacterized protein n=1 Tax=Candidatus Liberibacter ctenarytainae TaxID=2020335 RepID=A0A937AF68_9HYPH|nr:hypothetical protein [Candidatus Liberibacter ctenarytainae]